MREFAMRFAGSVKLRPVRIGFLVPPDNLAIVRKVVRLCSCVWGGRYNPIIPFFTDTPARWIERHSKTSGLDIARGYVNFFEPDVLVETTEGMAKALGWHGDERDSLGLPRTLSLDSFYSINYQRRVEFAAGIDISNVIHRLYDEEYKYQRRHKVPFAFVKANEDDAFFDIFPGRYPDDEPLRYIVDAYREVFEPEELLPNVETSLKISEMPFAGPLWISRHTLEERPGRGLSDETIFVFDASDVGDVIDYWNCRLVERRVRPVNVRWLPDHAKPLRELITRVHRPIPGNPSGMKYHARLIFGRAIADEEMLSLVKQHFADLPQGSFSCGHYQPYFRVMEDTNRWQNRKILVAAASASFDEQITSERSIKVPAPAPAFDNAAQLYTKSRWINVVVPSSAFHDDETATVYPSNLWKPGYPGLGVGRDLVVTREGWTIRQEHSFGYSLLSPVNGREALIGWFKANSVEAYPSEEGQIATQVITTAGSLLACGMFADRETILLLNSMAESHEEPRRAGKRVRTINPDRAKHVNTVRQHFDQRAKRSIGFWNKLDYFLSRLVFRTGLRVQCPTCAHYNWIDLDAVSYTPTCSRCLKEFKFPQAPSDLGQIHWYYRVIGPFAAPDYARGAYAVALTLRCLAERHETEMTWSTGLVLESLNCEIDFAAWYRRGSMLDDERDEPILLVGEAKSFGKNTFDETVVASLRRVAERFPGTIMVVSSLRAIADYEASELRRLADLALWGRSRTRDGKPLHPLIILTATELFSEHGIRNAWKSAGGRAAQLVQPGWVDFSDLHQLAEATQRLYLNLPSWYEERINSATLEFQRTRLLRLIKSRQGD